MNRTTLNLMCLALLTAGAAYAQENDELVEKVAVRNRLFSVEGRFELGGNVGLSILPRLTDHYNLNLSVAYNLKDWFAIEVRGGYAISRHTSLADQIQTDFQTRPRSVAQDASDLWELTGHGVAGIRFQPIYGKLNLMSEVPVHFQLYLWAGGGVAALRKESMVQCAVRVSARECGEFLVENKVSPLVSLALGFRFFIAQHHSVKLEVRDWSYLDSYLVNIDRTTGTGGIESPNAGITNLVQFDLGYSFIF
jgi:outer membrane beta-barrel protein